MKKILLSLAVVLMVSGFSYRSQAQGGTFTVTWKFINVEEGYDHKNKCEVYIDDELVGTSTETLETETNSITVEVPTGSHRYKVMNLALYEGEWEEHTVANDYSWDCFDEGTHNFGKKNKLFLLFDIDEGVSTSWKKMPKPAKKK